MATATEMKVHILSCTPNAEKVCAATAKQCYSPEDAETIINKLTDEDTEKTLRHCIKSRHLAVLASAHATVAVNVTRECLTQLNTHAFIKTVTQSQQYVDHRDFRYFIPEIIQHDKHQARRFVFLMTLLQEEYNWHRDRTYKNLLNQGVPEKEALSLAKATARQVLPNAAEANTILSGNFWSWFNWLQRRVCKRNTPITLQLAQTILKEFREKWPLIFNLCGAPCEFGQCQEQKPCGRPYTRRAV